MYQPGIRIFYISKFGSPARSSGMKVGNRGTRLDVPCREVAVVARNVLILDRGSGSVSIVLKDMGWYGKHEWHYCGRRVNVVNGESMPAREQRARLPSSLTDVTMLFPP